MDGIIIETTGLADPAPVAQTFFADEFVSANMALDGILTVVDSKHIVGQLREAPAGNHTSQISYHLYHLSSIIIYIYHLPFAIIYIVVYGILYLRDVDGLEPFGVLWPWGPLGEAEGRGERGGGADRLRRPDLAEQAPRPSRLMTSCLKSFTSCSNRCKMM